MPIIPMLQVTKGLKMNNFNFNKHVFKLKVLINNEKCNGTIWFWSASRMESTN